MRTQLALAVALLLAEPPPPMEPRDVKVILEALKKAPAQKAQLASVRWFVEVLKGTSLQVPIGSPPTTLGPWGDDGALSSSEADLRGRDCGPLNAEELKAASALLAQYPEQLPTMLRGYALAQTGKKEQAAKLFHEFVESQLPSGCPSEHPMYSNRRMGRMSLGIRCLEKWSPEHDVSKLKKLLKQAERCAADNHAVG